MYLSPTPAPPRLAELWPAVRDRIDTAKMQALLGGEGRVYTATEDYEDDEGARGQSWGRVVILPAQRAGGGQESPTRYRVPDFLVRSEVHSPSKRFDPTELLEGIQAEAFARLEGWKPTGFDHLSVALGVFRSRLPQASPVWDEERGLYLIYSTYRVVVGPAA